MAQAAPMELSFSFCIDFYKQIAPAGAAKRFIYVLTFGNNSDIVSHVL